MAHLLDPEIIGKLKEFQKGELDLQSFQKWISVHSDQLRLFLAPDVLLCLKRGDKQKAMKAVVMVLPACSACAHIGDIGVFSSRQEHSACIARVKESVLRGVLKGIPRPKWFHASGHNLGADGYFECENCSAIWTLVEPEREDNGLWERLG
jgi:hypothetical protein